MGCWKYPKGWRYQFQRKGKTYSRGWFKTKAEGLAAEARHKAELAILEKNPPQTQTVIGYGNNRGQH
jgi:hypothetical protein